jgi:hypothetical protein
VPFENILGSPEVVTTSTTTKGFKGAMATFDATRPLVAATGIGVARATLELLKELLQQQGVTIRYGLPRQKLTNIEREVIDMEIMLRSAWLLVIKAVWMADNKMHNPLEASMSKVRAGDVVTKITQKAVEIMGPVGYSRDYLLEKWFRDAKITDIYEGTGQINRLIVARNILGYSGRELRESILADNSYFTRMLVSYPSDGLKIYGFMNVPKQGNPPYPVIVAIHGYIEPEIIQRWITRPAMQTPWHATGTWCCTPTCAATRLPTLEITSSGLGWPWMCST